MGYSASGLVGGRQWPESVLWYVSKAYVKRSLTILQGQHSGYGGYGNWTRGSRQVLIHENTLQDLNHLELDTWIRLETQDVVGAVTLNATYGQDHYPATKDTRTSCPTCG